MNQKNPIKTIAITIGAGAIVIIIISVLALSGIFHSNPYGPEQKITNFSRYFKNVPTSTRDMLYTSLYNIVSLNLEDQAPYPDNITATIRKDTANTTYNEDTDIYSNNFIVDVTSINQSFKVWFEWSKDQNNPNLSGYQVSITCTPQEDSLYNSSTCKDGSSVSNPVEDLYDTHPLLAYLPLDVAFYTDSYSGYTHYTVTYEIEPDLEDENKEDIVIVITDYTGGNYDRAVAKLKTYENNLDSYIIHYIDESDNFIPARPPESDIVEQ